TEDRRPPSNHCANRKRDERRRAEMPQRRDRQLPCEAHLAGRSHTRDRSVILAIRSRRRSLIVAYARGSERRTQRPFPTDLAREASRASNVIMVPLWLSAIARSQQSAQTLGEGTSSDAQRRK